MAQLWMVKVDPFDVMISPVEFFGPIERFQPVDWRGFNNNDSLGPDVTEKQWPDFCRHRNLSWNILGTRPFRPMPRALRWSLSPSPKPIGSIPAGIVDHEFLIVDPSNGDPDPKTAVYTGTDVGSVYDMRFFLRFTADSHRTSAEPTNWTEDDYVLLSLLTYVGPADRWSLLLAPDDWNLSDILPIVEVPSLAYSKPEEHPAGFSRQILWLADPDVTINCSFHAQLPYVDDWFFGVPSQFIEVTPVPATLATWKVIDPIFGPVTGQSSMQYWWAEFLEVGRIRVRVRWDGIVGRHFVTVWVDEPGGIHEIDGGSQAAPFDIECECRQNGPLVRIDVSVAGELKGTEIFAGTYHKCLNRFLLWQSSYAVPHFSQISLKTVQ